MVDFEYFGNKMASGLDYTLLTLRELYQDLLGVESSGYSAALIETPITAVSLTSSSSGMISTTCESISKPIAIALV